MNTKNMLTIYTPICYFGVKKIQDESFDGFSRDLVDMKIMLLQDMPALCF